MSQQHWACNGNTAWHASVRGPLPPAVRGPHLMIPGLEIAPAAKSALGACDWLSLEICRGEGISKIPLILCHMTKSVSPAEPLNLSQSRHAGIGDLAEHKMEVLVQQSRRRPIRRETSSSSFQ